MLQMLYTIFLFVVANIIIWYQLNSQLVWEWAKSTKSMWIHEQGLDAPTDGSIDDYHYKLKK